MKMLLAGCSLGLLLAFVSTRAAAEKPLETVPSVDLKRYAGTWYEIGSIPKFFQKGCSRTTATYRPRPDGDLDVQNVCNKHGELSSVKGKAWAVDKTNAKLKVRFFWFITGDYWIIALDPEYRYAMVGTPDRDSLWILSRTPLLDEAVYKGLLNQAKAQGFDIDKVEKTSLAVK
jgi:apolipoprotein D and lipocalin family protein